MRWSIVGSVVVFGLSCAAFWFSTRIITLPPAWYSFEFCQYAEIGKNLATEGAFDTRLVEPMALAYIDTHHLGPPGRRWPVINRYPLPCLVVAGLMKAFGPNDRAAAWSNGLAVGGLAVLAYVLARRWYGSGWAAVVGLLVVANPAFYGNFILLGTPDVWFALLFGLELLAWCKLVDGPGARHGRAVVTGVLAGLAYLTRFNVVIFLAPQVAVLLARRRWRDTAILVLSALIVTLPLLAYNTRHFGRPYVGIYSAWNLLDDIGAYRVEPWLYYRVPDVATELRIHLSGLVAKFVTNVTSVVPVRIWSLWDLFLIMPLVVVALLIGEKRDDGDTVPRRFLLWSAGLFAFQLVLFSALRLELEDFRSPNHGRYFFWFAVPAVLLGVGALRRLTAWSRLWYALAALVVAGQLALFGWIWTGWATSIEETNLGYDPIRQAIAAIVGERQVIASNQPHWTAWFSGRKSVSLPADPDELARLNRDSKTPIDYLYIESDYNAIDMDVRWLSFVQPAPGGPTAWERAVLANYEYALAPAQTRPLNYVLLRRRDVPPSRLERSVRGSRRAD